MGEEVIAVNQGCDSGGCPTGLAVELGEDGQILDKFEIEGEQDLLMGSTHGVLQG